MYIECELIQKFLNKVMLIFDQELLCNVCSLTDLLGIYTFWQACTDTLLFNFAPNLVSKTLTNCHKGREVYLDQRQMLYTHQNHHRLNEFPSF